MSRFGTCAMTLCALAGVFGCSDDAGPSSGTPGTAGAAGSAGASGAGGGAGAGGGGGDAVSFATDIYPILSMKCGGSDCHGTDQPPFKPGHGAANVDDAYDATQGVGSMGQPVYQRILVRVTSEDPGVMMPPNYANPPCPGEVGAPGCISEAELALLEAWVAQGAPP